MFPCSFKTTSEHQLFFPAEERRSAAKIQKSGFRRFFCAIHQSTVKGSSAMARARLMASLS